MLACSSVQSIWTFTKCTLLSLTTAAVLLLLAHFQLFNLQEIKSKWMLFKQITWLSLVRIWSPSCKTLNIRPSKDPQLQLLNNPLITICFALRQHLQFFREWRFYSIKIQWVERMSLYIDLCSLALTSFFISTRNPLIWSITKLSSRVVYYIIMV